MAATLEVVGKLDVAERATTMLTAMAKWGGVEVMVALLVGVLRRRSDWVRESEETALVAVCRRLGQGWWRSWRPCRGSSE